MTERRTWFSTIALFCAALAFAVGCARAPSEPPIEEAAPPAIDLPTITLGYSSWPGWWPWAIADREGLFAKNGINVRLLWFDSYGASMEALAAGQLDANCQTLSDTISFAADAIEGEVAVLVNDNSAGNDKIVAAAGIDRLEDLRGQQVAIEQGVVVDFLLALALEDAGMSRDEIEIVGMDTADAALAFIDAEVDAVGAFPPFWAMALTREGSREIVSSAQFPGAIPDLLVVTQTLIDSRPEIVEGLVATWFDILAFMDANPDRSDEILAARANVALENLARFKDGTKLFTIEDNLTAFRDGDTMQSLPFAARRTADFMLDVGFIRSVLPLEPLLDDSFVLAYSQSRSASDPGGGAQPVPDNGPDDG
ncbi:MAG: ABC transporter substrate-binding protein [Geitlerinemataceae cyanobacterium]